MVMENQRTEFEQVAALSWLLCLSHVSDRRAHLISVLTPFFPLFSPLTSGLFHLMASDLEPSTCEFIWSEEG